MCFKIFAQYRVKELRKTSETSLRILGLRAGNRTLNLPSTKQNHYTGTFGVLIIITYDLRPFYVCIAIRGS
jgi:hypothetical protein